MEVLLVYTLSGGNQVLEEVHSRDTNRVHKVYAIFVAYIGRSI